MSTRRWPKRFLYSAATRAGAVFTQACHLQEPWAASPITWHPSRDAPTCYAPFGANPASASFWLYRLRVACRGCFVVLCCRWVYCITINSIVKQFFLLICLCICVILINTFNLFVIPSKHGKNAKAKNRGARNPPSARLLGKVPRSLEGQRPERCGYGVVCKARESRASQIE